MSQIKKFFCGNVDFKVQGLPIACLNKLREYKISNVKICEDIISFSVPLVNAMMVKRLVSNFDWQMQENFNIWRSVNFLLNRFVLSISILLCLAVFFVIDLGIYDVKVVTSNPDLTGEVYTHLQSLGVKKFMFKSQVQNLDLASDLIATFPNVAHANVRIAGNTLLINLSEASNYTTKAKTNIYSQYNAVIKKVIAFSGNVLVEPGDVVKKGDLLVENAYQDSVAIIGEVAYLRGEEIIRLDIAII